MEILNLINMSSNIDINKILMSDIKTNLKNFYQENKIDIYKAYYLKYKENIKKFRKKNYIKNKEKLSEIQKIYNLKNKDKFVCEICNYKTYKNQFLQIHNNTLKHKKNEIMN